MVLLMVRSSGTSMRMPRSSIRASTGMSGSSMVS
jgi:hypothetical protein